MRRHFFFYYANKTIKDDQNCQKLMEVTLERETIDLKTASEQWFQTVLKKLRKMAGTKKNIINQ